MLFSKNKDPLVVRYPLTGSKSLIEVGTPPNKPTESPLAIF